MDDVKFKYKGFPLDSADVQLLPEDLRSLNFNTAPAFFACYRFNIDSQHIGLITRTPSTYVSSSIRLLVYDVAQKTITHHTELAGLWGDVGDYYDKRSWMCKGSNGEWEAYIWEEAGHDNSVDDPADSTISSHNHYYQLGIKATGIDTLSKDSISLAKQVRQMASGI